MTLKQNTRNPHNWHTHTDILKGYAKNAKGCKKWWPDGEEDQELGRRRGAMKMFDEVRETPHFLTEPRLQD